MRSGNPCHDERRIRAPAASGPCVPVRIMSSQVIDGIKGSVVSNRRGIVGEIDQTWGVLQAIAGL